MLRVTIELCPGGRESEARKIGSGYIANITDLAAVSDYSFEFVENEWRGRARGPYQGILKGWRREENGVWGILHAALSTALPGTKQGSVLPGVFAFNRSTARGISRGGCSMPRRSVECCLLHQVMERAWLIMSLISCALSDHPLVRPNRANRHCVDRARKALFDLYKAFEAEMIAAGAVTGSSPNEQREESLQSEDGFGANLLRRKGRMPKSVDLGLGEGKPAHPIRRPGRRRRRRKV